LAVGAVKKLSAIGYQLALIAELADEVWG